MTEPALRPASLATSAATNRPGRRPPQITVLYGDLRTGRIRGEIPATAAGWGQTLNAPGPIERVVIPDDVLADLDLRRTAPAARSFLAIELDGWIQEAGPIWARAYDWERGQATFGAAGLWSLFDYRMVLPILAGPVRTGADLGGVTVAGTDLGGIARHLVWLAMQHAGGDLPIVLEPARPGTRTETFPGWALHTVAQQLKELTQRENAAPDIRFVPRRRPDDRRFIEWALQTGTETEPQLSQVGADWVLDTRVPRGPVLGIGTDEDATAMGMRSWLTGNGSEADAIMATAADMTLVHAGWPLLEVEESRSTVERHATLQGHADSLVARRARPVETWKVTVHASAAREVAAGDYCQLVTGRHPWLGAGRTRMRVQAKTGGLDDRVTLDMYQMPAEVEV